MYDSKNKKIKSRGKDKNMGIYLEKLFKKDKNGNRACTFVQDMLDDSMINKD